MATSHAKTSEVLFPGYHVRAITNGVHPHTWTCLELARVFDEYVPGWCHEPELLVRADRIPDEHIWGAHRAAKESLLCSIADRTGARFDLDQPLLGFARRMTGYKRPDLLFTDLERLKNIAAKFPFQVVLSGKAHPRDMEGKRLIELLHMHIRELADSIPVAFLPDYDLATALSLVSGVDVWLNTPQPPLEASGTSGMKAAFNGVPSLSVVDGWWQEGCIEGVTGWAITDGPQTVANGAGALYRKLEHIVLPLFTSDHTGWVTLMKNVIAKNASYFNSHRKIRRYVTEAYIR